MRSSATSRNPNGRDFSLAEVDRRTFILGSVAFAASPRLLGATDAADRYVRLQAMIDEVTPAAWRVYRNLGDARECAALKELDRAFESVTRRIAETVVTDRPAVWFVYNMGVVVKTREALFSIDLVHPRATELVPQLDFALITHNHGDHYTEAFFEAMDRAGTTVIQNFACNYGVKDWKAHGGYTRGEKTFRLKDVSVTTSLTDHNDYLVDFTTAFEIAVGDFTIYHTGDCSTAKKIRLLRPNPDLWIVHPRCGLKPCEGAAAIRPKKTILAHLNEMGHARDRWRWSWQDGLKEKELLEAAGFAAEVPLWGDRIV